MIHASMQQPKFCSVTELTPITVCSLYLVCMCIHTCTVYIWVAPLGPGYLDPFFLEPRNLFRKSRNFTCILTTWIWFQFRFLDRNPKAIYLDVLLSDGSRVYFAAQTVVIHYTLSLELLKKKQNRWAWNFCLVILTCKQQPNSQQLTKQTKGKW